MKLDSWESLINYNISADQSMPRTPEPSAVTDQLDSVNDYNQVMATNMTVNYSVVLDIIYRSRQQHAAERALDLCSGPGHLTTCLSTYLNYKNVVGVDFSQPMVDIANENSRKLGLSNQVNFQKADVTDLKKFIGQQSFDLVSFTNSAHHFSKIKDVQNVLTCAESMVSAHGLVVLFDLARLKNKIATDAFIELAGKDFLDRKMNAMHEDFRNSMHAAWLPSELVDAIPQNTKRVWFQILPIGLTSFQALVGVPVEQSEVFSRDSFAWEATGLHQSEDAKGGWQFYKYLLDNAEIKVHGQKIKAA